MIKAVGAVALTIVLLAGVTATADPEACRGSIRTFKSARSSVGDYLRRYASCVSRSDGHDVAQASSRDFAQRKTTSSRLRRTMTATACNTPRNPTDRVVGMSALGHVWTAPWQELSDVAAALVGCGHVSSFVADVGAGTRDNRLARAIMPGEDDLSLPLIAI